MKKINYYDINGFSNSLFALPFEMATKNIPSKRITHSPFYNKNEKRRNELIAKVVPQVKPIAMCFFIDKGKKNKWIKNEMKTVGMPVNNQEIIKTRRILRPQKRCML